MNKLIKEYSKNVPCTEVTSLSNYLNAIKEDTKKWKRNNEMECPWFRGQDNVKEDPKPGIFRKKYNEFWMSTTFRNRGIHFENSPETERIDKWLFLMQHFGLPTRLLDWTESPLIALFFAIRDLKKSKNPAIWMIHPIELNKISSLDIFPNTWANENGVDYFRRSFGMAKYKNLLPIAVQPSYVHLRMLVQKSVFTIHGIKELGFEKLLMNSYFLKNGFFKKYVIYNKNVISIFSELKKAGISNSTVFPDYEGLALELKDRLIVTQ